MQFIHEKEYLSEVQSINDILLAASELPHHIFRNTLSHYRFLDFDSLYCEDLFECMKQSGGRNSLTSFILAMLEPKPQWYFSKFSVYPIVKVQKKTEYNDYIKVISSSPLFGKDEGILTIVSEVLLAYSSDSNWAIYFNRDFGIGILAEASRSNFASEFLGANRLFMLEDILGGKALNVSYSKDIADMLRRNYGGGDRTSP